MKSSRLLFLSMTALCSLALADVPQHGASIGDPALKGRFTTIREPSGVTMLDAQTLIVVEDEASHALRRLEVSASDPLHFRFQEFDQRPAKGFIQRQQIGPLDDLEGIARVSSNQYIIIGSHENASRGKLPAREKIVLLTRDGADVTSTAIRYDLFDQLAKRYPELAKIVEGSKKGGKNALNIEAIAFDRKRQVLQIGLRAPLLDNNAIVISLDNSIDYLEGAEPEFSSTLRTIDLGKNGIRAMAYDDLSDTYFIIGKQESGGKNRSTLWTLSATLNTVPVRYESDKKSLFDDVEGLSPISGGVLFVRDNGGKVNNDDQWFILTRSQLGLYN